MLIWISWEKYFLNLEQLWIFIPCREKIFAFYTWTKNQVCPKRLSKTQSQLCFSAEHAMVGATGKPFGSHKIKVEYGSLSKKPIYDKHSRKVRYPSHQSKSKSVFNLISRLFFTLRIFLMHPWTILIYFEKNSIYLALLRMLKLSKANI